MSPAARYRSGRVPLAVAPSGLFALDASPAALEPLWLALEQGHDLGAILQSLAQAHGNNVFELPDFVVVVIGQDGARVAARGRFRLVVDTPQGNQTLSAPQAVAWDEFHLATPLSFSVELDEPADARCSEALALRSGIVAASHLDWGERARTVGAASPTTVPEPVVSRDPQEPGACSAAASPRPPHRYAAPSPLEADEVPLPPVPLPPVPPPLAAPTEAFATLGPEALVEAVCGPASTSPTEGHGTVAPEAGGPAPDTTDAARRAEDSYFGHLFEHTRSTSVEDAAIRSVHSEDVDPLAAREVGTPAPDGSAPPPPDALAVPPVSGPGPASAPPGAGESWQHDGRTVSSAQLRAMRDALVQQAGGAPTGAQRQQAPETDGPLVLAAFCVAGHPNAPHATECRICTSPISARTGHVTRPRLGVLRCSTGACAELDADVIVGRLPQGTDQPGRPSPHLMVVPSPEKAISKNHCAVRVDGWDVAVADLGSTNGTLLVRPGEPPRRVPEHGNVFLRPGDVVDLGDSITLTFEAQP